jgi:hypothetical protein
LVFRVECSDADLRFDRALTLRSEARGREISEMKRELPEVDNVVVDEANAVTYVVTARRRLTDGEIYSAIRIALLKRAGKRLQRGETLKIVATRRD